METTDTPRITATVNTRSTVYSVADLGVVASVRYQGGWIVRRVLSPDEFTLCRVATREHAEALAVRHAIDLVDA